MIRIGVRTRAVVGDIEALRVTGGEVWLRSQPRPPFPVFPGKPPSPPRAPVSPLLLRPHLPGVPLQKGLLGWGLAGWAGQGTPPGTADLGQATEGRLGLWPLPREQNRPVLPPLSVHSTALGSLPESGPQAWNPRVQFSTREQVPAESQAGPRAAHLTEGHRSGGQSPELPRHPHPHLVRSTLEIFSKERSQMESFVNFLKSFQPHCRKYHPIQQRIKGNIAPAPNPTTWPKPHRHSSLLSPCVAIWAWSFCPRDFAALSHTHLPMSPSLVWTPDVRGSILPSEFRSGSGGRHGLPGETVAMA